MPATAKRGFRLPWMRDDAGADAVGTQVLDGRPGDAPTPDADPEHDPDVAALDDLGSGPFGIAPPPPPQAAPPREAAPAREAGPMEDPGDVFDLEARTSPELSRDDATGGEPGSELPKWLRQGTSASVGDASWAGSAQADARPGIHVSPTIEPVSSNGSVPHGVAPASAWPEADFAARAAAAQSHGPEVAVPDGQAQVRRSEGSAAADPGSPDPGSISTVPETPRANAEAAQPDAEPTGEASPAPDHAAASSAPEGSGDALAQDGAEPPRAATAASATSGLRSGPARGAASASTAHAASLQTTHERRDNPLLTGLVKAMRDSARITREETTARLRVEAEARVVAIRGRSAADAVALRTQAEEDMAGIREWSKAEMARIRLQTAERIEARRGQLATDSHALSSLTGRLVTEIEGAVASFETEMKRFFKALLAEEDPTQLATLAEQMPVPPVLESLPQAVAVGIDHVSSGARSRANRATSMPANGAKRAARPPTSRSAGGAGAAARARSRAATAAPAGHGDLPAGAGPTLDATGLDPEAAALAEAEALAGLDLSAMTGEWHATGDTPSSNGMTPHVTADDATLSETEEPGAEPEPAREPASELAPQPATELAPFLEDEEFMIESQTRLIVSGLGDAGIVAFAGALREVPGVGSVNVSPGGDGEVVFSVTHGTSTDLRAAVPELDGFRAHVTADEGAILSVAAQDPH